MLCLTRTPGLKILIGPDITIEVLDIIGNKVRLGITAPREVPVHREEVAGRIARDGARSVAATNGHPRSNGKVVVS